MCPLSSNRFYQRIQIFVQTSLQCPSWRTCRQPNNFPSNVCPQSDGGVNEQANRQCKKTTLQKTVYHGAGQDGARPSAQQSKYQTNQKNVKQPLKNTVSSRAGTVVSQIIALKYLRMDDGKKQRGNNGRP